jgi:hypothetical protein
MGTKTYTVTDSTTLTITDCPCTYTSSWSTKSTWAPASSKSTRTSSKATSTWSAPASSPTWTSSESTPTWTSSGAAPTWTNATSTYPVVWVTETVSWYTTYCPVPTTVVQGSQTYTVCIPISLGCQCLLSKDFDKLQSSL